MMETKGVVSTTDVKLRLERLSTLLDGFNNYAVHVTPREVASAHPKSDRKPSSRHGNRPVFFTEWRKPETPQATSVTSLPRIKSSHMKPLLGGIPIDYDTARILRAMTCGSAIHRLSQAWMKAGFVYQSLDSTQPYGLLAERNGTRGLIMCVQAYVIKHLVFRYSTKEEINRKSVLKPSARERTGALVSALCEILWRAGRGIKATVCLPQDETLFTRTSQYNCDGITEKLHLFEFTHYEDLQMFIKKYISYFEYASSSGCLLYLYSVILSRSIRSVHSDQGMEDVQLLTGMEACTQSLLNLLLTGRAVPLLHNGTITHDADGDALERPLKGIHARSEVGFLYWDREEDDKKRTQVGSMLRTPRKPIWVTKVNGQNIGVMFGVNPELVSNWRAENWFTLYYYTGLTGQTVSATLSIDTRNGRLLKGRTSAMRRKEERKIPSLERCIMSKYPGAEIDWHGTMPFV